MIHTHRTIKLSPPQFRNHHAPFQWRLRNSSSFQFQIFTTTLVITATTLKTPLDASNTLYNDRHCYSTSTKRLSPVIYQPKCTSLIFRPSKSEMTQMQDWIQFWLHEPCCSILNRGFELEKENKTLFKRIPIIECAVKIPYAIQWFWIYRNTHYRNSSFGKQRVMITKPCL